MKSKIKNIFNKIVKKYDIKCYSKFYYPYIQVNMCNCNNKCKFPPPDGCIENYIEEKIYYDSLKKAA
tara:strand:- start:1495 stop:1695 length:201 start_codon:yes stop_codon:yes gene_type:complete